ncbi:MAG: hypothetical protein ACR2LJ_02460 [Acidimicrobiales bacterium]
MRKIIGVLMGAAMLVGVAGPASAATNNQQFEIVVRFNGNDTASCRVIATGPIQGVGTCTTTDVSNNVTDVHLILPGGTVDLRARQFGGTDSFNQQACVDTFTFKENFRVTGGTGAFAGVTGSGVDIGRGVFTAARTAHGCDPNQGRGSVLVTVTGHISLRGGSAAA